MTERCRSAMLYDACAPLDPLGDADAGDREVGQDNRAKVGSSRPSSLLYTYGPGAIMDLPQFTVMPAGLDDWDRIWNRREGIPHDPRAAAARRGPHAPALPRRRSSARSPGSRSGAAFTNEGNDLGVPARVFPQWLRCTGCDMLGLLSQFDYTNTHPFRTDLACFEHTKCPGRGRRRQDGPPHRRSGPVPAGLRERPPGRVPLRPVGPPRQAVPEGGDSRPEDGRPDRRQGRSAMIRCVVLRAAAADERGAGPGGRGQAAEVPRPAPAPRRVRAGRLRRPGQADADRRVEPVVPGDSVDHRDAGISGGEGQRPGRPDPRGPRRASSPGIANDLETLRDVLDGKVDVSDLTDTAFAELLAVPTDDWMHLHTAEVPRALPALPAASPLRRDVALGDGLFVAGDHRDTPSQQGALVSGRRAAEAVLAHLGA